MINNRISKDLPRHEINFKSRKFIDDLNVSMLIEDLQTRLINYRNRADWEELKVSIRPEKEEAEKLFINAMPYNRYKPYDLEDAVRNYIEVVARKLVYQGYCLFEIVEYEDGSIQLVPFIGRRSFFRFKGFVQVFNKNLREFSDGKKRIYIPANKCIYIDFPKEIIGGDKYFKYLQKISGHNLVMQKNLKHLENQSKNIEDHYSFTKHRRKNEIYNWRLTKEIGWHHRAYLGTSKDFGFEFYRHGRILSFRKSKIILRDHILNSLLNFIEFLSTKLETPTVFEFNGLMSLQDIEEKMQEWNSGSMKFNEVSRYI